MLIMHLKTSIVCDRNSETMLHGWTHSVRLKNKIWKVCGLPGGRECSLRAEQSSGTTEWFGDSGTCVTGRK